MGSKVLKAESLLRGLSLVLAAIAALLMGLNQQTKTVFFEPKKATVNDIEAFRVFTGVLAIAAGYHLLQLSKCLAFQFLTESPCWCNKLVAWLCFLIDQVITYAAFVAAMAALQASTTALFGIGHLQWAKLCNIYTRFCVQVGASLVCALAATLTMAAVSAISAHRLFRLYPASKPAVSAVQR
ncbi:CASP-like protein 2C1 [Typha latifolia]|uniref:CASP-like protein 2C1 n=1 Tax=Typha latifolia TaxID=4733 RepID=UPI003C2F161B